MVKKTKLDTVIIVNDFDYTQGGASKIAIDTANLLVDSCENIKVYFFSGNHNNSSTLKDKVIKICTNQEEALRDKNKIRGAINGIYNFKAKKELKKILNKCNPKTTVIHVHGWTKCLSSSVFDIAFKKKFKVVLTMHDYFTACPNGGYFNYRKNEICNLKPLSWKCVKCNCDSRNYAFKLYRVLRQFVQNKIVGLNERLENVISISDFSEKILRKTLNPKTEITKISNPIDIFCSKKTANFKNNDYFLYVGRISKEKGVDVFCKAITELNLKGIIVGDGDQKTILEKKFPNIEFVGWKTKIEVQSYMIGARALIFCSKCYETAGLTALEAISLGIPIVVNRYCAASEFIVENTNGVTYDGSVFDLIAKINLFLSNDNGISSDKCIETFLEYDNNYYRNLISFYEKIVR